MTDSHKDDVSPPVSSPSIAEFQKIILDNFRRDGRSFPWRETSDPYEILVSEIMLQQTQTERVVPKYIAWLERFPNVHSLAIASLGDVLSFWSGLGYNRRARFLQEASRELSRILDDTGTFPQTPEELDKLPGVGQYTARAVSTFAFNRPEVFIETNIRSVFLFFFFQNTLNQPDSDIKVHDKEIIPLITESLYRENPREWYYALMDYGAALKKIIKNPNRKSAHYTKQSRFEGSLRQARGAILRQLTSVSASNSNKNDASNVDPSTATSLSLADIAKAENISYERLEEATITLCAEKLLYKDGDVYRIPS